MFAVENIRKIFPLLEELEKEHPGFSQEEKQVLYRTAFYADSYEDAQEASLHIAKLNPGTAERQEVLARYAKKLPEPPCNDAEQIEGCIFQLQHMCHEREKTIAILEDILKKCGFSKEALSMDVQLEKRLLMKDENKPDGMATQSERKKLKEGETKKLGGMNMRAGGQTIKKEERGMTGNGKPR